MTNVAVYVGFYYCVLRPQSAADMAEISKKHGDTNSGTAKQRYALEEDQRLRDYARWFAVAVNDLVKDRGFTRQEIEDRCSLGKRQLDELFGNNQKTRKNPQLSTIAAMCNVFDVDPCRLFKPTPREPEPPKPGPRPVVSSKPSKRSKR